MSPNDANAMPEASIIKDGVEYLKNPTRKDLMDLAKEDDAGAVRTLNIGDDTYAWKGSDAPHGSAQEAFGTDKDMDRMNDGEVFYRAGNRLYPESLCDIGNAFQGDIRTQSDLREALGEGGKYSPSFAEINTKEAKQEQEDRLKDFLPSLGIAGGSAGALAAIQPKQASAAEQQPQTLDDKLKMLADNYQQRLLSSVSDQEQFTKDNISSAFSDPTQSLAARAARLGLGTMEGIGVPETSVVNAVGGMYADSPLGQTMSYNPSGQMYGTK